MTEAKIWIEQFHQHILSDDESHYLVGCTEAQVVEVEMAYGFRLPEFVREFYLKMGIQRGGLFVGYDSFFPRMIDMRNRWYLSEAKLKEMQDEEYEVFYRQYTKPNMLFHVSWLGEWLDFSYVEVGVENPPVYRIDRDLLTGKRISDHFSDYIVGEWDAHLVQLKEVKARVEANIAISKAQRAAWEKRKAEQQRNKDQADE